ncbi:hypothetical protein Rhe02_92010 [Rhizocola hellebori]|uniref:DUF998 domain-containing protein n=1 Tax=Rhizocola hellebori TaxID=1392758 RepID=A0A8J3QJZ2_9ACTN|nr:DUF998 domain-containing protein [Rhizocola hellebori]GIH11134.1 hypothetical protein Rhe02_92010 [Rhizocola hellebori]
MQQVFRAQPLALGGLAATAAGTVAMTALHLLPPSDRIDPIRRTISEYALHETAWLFNLAVLSLALGALAILLALARAKVVRPASLGGAGLLAWSAGLTAVVYFPKHNWTVGPSASGDIHRVASLAAFIGLPVAAIAIAWAWRHDNRWRVCALWTLTCAVAALLLLGVILGAFALQPVTGVRWWRIIPLGAVERGLGIAEVATVFALGWWAWLTQRTGRSHPGGVEGNSVALKA